MLVCAGVWDCNIPEMTFRFQEEPVTSAKAPVPNTAPAPANPVVWVTALVAAVVSAVLIVRIPPLAHPWPQGYDPLGHWWLSALVAALPVVVLLGSLAVSYTHLQVIGTRNVLFQVPSFRKSYR